MDDETITTNERDQLRAAAAVALDALTSLARSDSTDATVRVKAAMAVLEAYRWVDSKDLQMQMMQLQADRSGGLFG